MMSERVKMNTFYRWDGEVLILNILGTPNAKTNKIGKPKGNQLKVNVAAVPRGGKATDHMVKFFAKEFGVKIADIEVVFGRMNVNKQVRITTPKSLPNAIARLEGKG